MRTLLTETITKYYDLPRVAKLYRQYGIREFTEDLDKICNEQYGENYARYDPERDYCVVAFDPAKPKPMKVDLIKVPGY